MEGKTPSEFDEEEFLHRICATAERSALGHLVPVFRCATTAQSIQLYTSLVREERLRRKHDPKESKALEEMVAQDQTYIAEMVKIICGTAAPSLKESNGYSRERLLGAAGARQLPMSGFALAALAVRELDCRMSSPRWRASTVLDVATSRISRHSSSKLAGSLCRCRCR